MAASKKKRVEEEMGEENEDDMDYESNDELDSDEEEGAMEGEIQLDFEARVPEDGDFNGMRTLLQQVFLKANVDISELTNTLISQNYIGSVIKQPYSAEDEDDDDDDDDDDSVLALTTVLNLTERKELDCVKQVKSLLLERCKKCGQDVKDKVAKILSNTDQHVGYLMNERYVNLPPTLAVPMFESLIKEMDKAKQKNMKYNFDYFLMICKTYEMKTGHNKRETFFSNSEEEIFQEASALSFTYSVAHERDGIVEKWSAEEGMEPFRTVLIVPAEKFPLVIEKIKEELGQA